MMKIKPYIFKVLTFVFLITISLSSFELLIQRIPSTWADKEKIAFYVLGGSTSFGEPYNDNPSFIRLVTRKLNNKYNSKEIDVIMLAKGGKNILENYMTYLRQIILKPYKKSYTFIYTGINDIGKTNPDKYDVALESFFLRTYIGSFIYEFLINRGVLSFHDSSLLFDQRVNDLFSMASKYSEKVFVSTLAGNYHSFSPPIQKHLSDNEFIAHLVCEKEDNNIKRVRCLKTNKLNTRYLFYEEILNEYQASKNPAILEKVQSSWNRYESLRPALIKNAIINKNSKSSSNIYFIDFHKSLFTKGNGFVGDNFFVDPHHPNLEGHILLANLFLQKLSPSSPSISLKDVTTWYKNTLEEKEVVFSRIQWMFFQSQIEPYPFLRARDMLTILNKHKSLFNDFERYSISALISICSPYIINENKAYILNDLQLKYLKDYFLSNQVIKSNLKKYIIFSSKNNAYPDDIKGLKNQLLNILRD